MALSRQNRLSDKKELRNVIRYGKRFESPEFKIYLGKSDLPATKIAIVVSKKTDARSTARNKLKRRIGEAVKKFLPALTRSYNVVIMPKGNAKNLTFQELEAVLTNMFVHDFRHF